MTISASLCLRAVAVTFAVFVFSACEDGPPRSRLSCSADGAAPDGAMEDGGEDCFVDAEPSDGDASANGDDAPSEAGVSPAPESGSCDPLADPQAAPCAIADTYGVFVAASGADNGAGSAASPLRTIAEGVAAAQRAGKFKVFVCQGRYGESLALGGTHGDISIYGGLGCIAGWSWTGGLVDVAAPTSLAALRIDPTTNPVTVEDLSLTAIDAVGQDASGAGNSAIAAWASGATVTFRRVTFFAGKGADGAPGKEGALRPNYPASQPAAPPGLPFTYAPFALGAGGVNPCVFDAASSQGGLGGAPGDRVATAGYPGGGGSSAPSSPLASQSSINNGVGGLPSADCQPAAGAGHPGANGLWGAAGAMAPTYGTLFPGGWVPTSGQFGGDGSPGQGGGGGAGEPFSPSAAIFGGAGGGAGGCGGTGGGGGQGGGASFALVSLQSSVTLFSSTLIASDGGQGGTGGPGQAGQAGGMGGSGSCSGAGGPGGNGAGGSGGGGGTGGLSVALAYQGTLPTYDATTTLVVGAPGPEGIGGPPGTHAVTPGQVGIDGAPGIYGRGGLASLVQSL
jgi:hypothetical protein